MEALGEGGYTSMYFLLYFGYNKDFIAFCMFTLIYSASDIEYMHKNKNFNLDENILAIRLTPICGRQQKFMVQQAQILISLHKFCLTWQCPFKLLKP